MYCRIESGEHNQGLPGWQGSDRYSRIARLRILNTMQKAVLNALS